MRSLCVHLLPMLDQQSWIRGVVLIRLFLLRLRILVFCPLAFIAAEET